MNGVFISSVSFVYDSNMQVTGYNIGVDGIKGDVKSFNSTVYLNKDELNLSSVTELVTNKIKETL